MGGAGAGPGGMGDMGDMGGEADADDDEYVDADFEDVDESSGDEDDEN